RRGTEARTRRWGVRSRPHDETSRVRGAPAKMSRRTSPIVAVTGRPRATPSSMNPRRVWSFILPLAVSAAALGREPPDADDDGDDHWVLLDGQHNQINGSSEYTAAARAQQKNGEPLLYFRRDGKAWVVRDTPTLDRVRRAWAPVDALGKVMSDL